jgi:hypothetical protein
MTRFVAGVLLCFAGSFCFMACGAPPEEGSVGSMAEPAVLLKPPKHFSGEPEYPVEGPPKLDLPPPSEVEPSDPGPVQEPLEPPTYEPPLEPDEHNGVDPSEHGNPHHESTGNHGGPDVGGSGDGTHPSPEFGKVKCSNPAECVQKCEAKNITCPAAYATHPYKRDNVCFSGQLVSCAAYPFAGQECHYRYPNGEICVFRYYPSRPAMCGYHGGQDYPH